MKQIFSKTQFPKSPGGKLYHWKEADTSFDVPNNGKYVIKVTASAENGKQNKSGNDSDLRMSLDDYAFGKYEIHEEKVSWKGFGTSSAWDGASLKGGEKTNYYFGELKKGSHQVKFYADGNPEIVEMQVFLLEEGEKFELKDLKPSQSIQSNQKGIPWISLIFLGVKPKDFNISATTESAKQKGTTDGDNLKVVVNGKIIQNPEAPTSRKYKNFYFSGDMDEGQCKILKIDPKAFEFLEDSVELWYDGEPSVLVIRIGVYKNLKNWQEVLMNETKGIYYLLLGNAIAIFFKKIGWRYPHQFLKNALKKNPDHKHFKEKSKMVEMVKNEPAYQRVLELLISQIRNGVLEGQIHLGDEKNGTEIEFKKPPELFYSIHGVKKMIFKIKKRKKGEYKVSMILSDIYDFSKMTYKLSEIYKAPFIFANNQIDAGEVGEYIKNFEVKLEIEDTIILPDKL